MKKQLVISIILTLILAAISFIPTSTAHTEEEPLEIPLIAGQDFDNPVGVVNVWNDENDIHVEYVITDTTYPWVITETHLYVGKTNPESLTSAPGQFPYCVPYYSTDTIHEYVIALEDIDSYHLKLNNKGKTTGVWEADGTPGVETCNDVYIAAHAVVEYETVSQECIDVISDTDVQWLDTADTWNDAVYCFEHGSWPKISGVNYIWRTELTNVVYEYDNVPTYDSTKYGWLFKKEFTLPESAYDITGSIDVNVDNSYELFLNGVYVDGQGTMNKDGPDSYEWNDIRTYSITPTAGSNELSFRALNYFRTGSSTSNPAGLTFKANICYDYISEYQEETAWGKGDPFGNNWAMYFTYHIQPIEVEWPEGSTTTIAFEDLPIGEGNDYDYNDWVVDIETTATFWITTTGLDLTNIEFNIIPEARGAGYNHAFHMLIPAGTFGCDGTWTLVVYDGDGIEVSSNSGTFDASAINDFTIFSSTNDALPSMSNTNEGTSYVPTDRTATLSIDFGDGCEFDFSAYDPYSGFHGEGLFFDPYLHVHNTGQDIHTGDSRMLTVPADWMWPEESIAIWYAYPDVTEGNPPTFSTDWWLNYNDNVYQQP